VYGQSFFIGTPNKEVRTMAKAAAAKTPAKKPPTKSEIFATIAEETGLTKRQVAAVFESLGQQIGKSLGKRGPGQFTIPGLAKITVQRKPATKARKGINPFTGEETMFKAKPARNVVKMRPLKALKDMA
jgi:nucleoid DNA-binding protein